MRLSVLLLASLATGAVGCAGPLRVMERGAGTGASPYTFWPPPPGSTVWLPPTSTATESAGLGAVAAELDASLAGAGYVEALWYPIGSDYQHGFAITTRLERQNRDSEAERWSTFYPEPAGLRWLTLARSPALPHPVRYRAFLIAFTDLPMPGGTAAPFWNEHTLMDGPGAPERRSVAPTAKGRRITPSYRVVIYEYNYDWDEQLQRGALSMAGSADPVAAWPSALGGLAD